MIIFVYSWRLSLVMLGVVPLVSMIAVALPPPSLHLTLPITHHPPSTSPTHLPTTLLPPSFHLTQSSITTTQSPLPPPSCRHPVSPYSQRAIYPPSTLPPSQLLKITADGLCMTGGHLCGTTGWLRQAREASLKRVPGSPRKGQRHRAGSDTAHCHAALHAALECRDAQLLGVAYPPRLHTHPPTKASSAARISSWNVCCGVAGILQSPRAYQPPV